MNALTISTGSILSRSLTTSRQGVCIETNTDRVQDSTIIKYYYDGESSLITLAAVMALAENANPRLIKKHLNQHLRVKLCLAVDNAQHLGHV
jgi:hypothetical protein